MNLTLAGLERGRELFLIQLPAFLKLKANTSYTRIFENLLKSGDLQKDILKSYFPEKIKERTHLQ